MHVHVHVYLPQCYLLHQVERELKSVLNEWENDHERHFIVWDARYLDTIQRQWEEKNSTKEMEKIKRVSYIRAI